MTKANPQASSSSGSDVTYTLSNAKVTFGDGTNPPAPSDSVKVVGRISKLGKKCSQTGFTPTFTARKLAVQGAKKEKTSPDAGAPEAATVAPDAAPASEAAAPFPFPVPPGG
ncbi:MAG: hypothetical protein JO262_21515 [Solirubrobacterales bacterium]|nr:hypothetical protein [Solirubrobacterales bacterium]